MPEQEDKMRRRLAKNKEDVGDGELSGRAQGAHNFQKMTQHHSSRHLERSETEILVTTTPDEHWLEQEDSGTSPVTKNRLRRYLLKWSLEEMLSISLQHPTINI